MLYFYENINLFYKKQKYLMKEDINKFIDLYLNEDIKDGDHTSNACIAKNTYGKAELIVKESGILAGVEIAELIFKKLDPSIKLKKNINDGSKIKQGDIAFTVDGPSKSILGAERLVLNCMQRMSGIATKTYDIKKLILKTKTKILDTRKTTPGFRFFEKLAVKIGGGFNHRYGLYDMMMIKDNHIDFSGGIKKAIKNANEYQINNNLNLKIIIEARNLNEVNEIIKTSKVDRILLDNFSVEETKKAVEIINKKFEIESSGNITEINIKKYAECGVDFISLGALTHSANILDLSLKAKN